MKPIKLWAGFTFDNYTPDQLHITHKFFGEQSMDVIDEIDFAMQVFFATERKFPYTRFDKPEMFGANKDIRVLTPTKFDPADFFPELRAALDVFRPDDFDGYRPHVTHPTHEVIELPTTGYVLMAGRNTVSKWGK